MSNHSRITDSSLESKPMVQYVTFDSIREGVGASQVLAYLKKIATNRSITLINFEKDVGDKENLDFLNWSHLSFGKPGPFAGIIRILRIARVLKRKTVVHARGDFACLASLMRGCKNVIWDCRALTADQRYEISRESKQSVGYCLLRLCEYICANFSTHIIVITNKAKLEIVHRYDVDPNKISVISTCVDLDTFTLKDSLPPSKEIKILLSGTIGPQYDLELLKKLIEEMKQFCSIKVGLIASKGLFKQRYPFEIHEFLEVKHSEVPNIIGTYHVGFSVWNSDLGISLKSVAATKNAEFLACGRPIIVNLNQGDIGEAVMENQIGISTTSKDSVMITRYAQHLIKLLEDPELSTRCRNYAMKHYSLKTAVQDISLIYDKIASTHAK